jgi:hypothetical protein
VAIFTKPGAAAYAAILMDLRATFVRWAEWRQSQRRNCHSEMIFG